MMVSRGRRRQNPAQVSTPSKRRKIEAGSEVVTLSEFQKRHQTKPRELGTVLILGVGDTGQLGLGPDVTERSKPTRFSAASLTAACLDNTTAENFVQVTAGGMHTVCLTADGQVYTFGCNDEGALGRPSTLENNEEEFSDEMKKCIVEESRPGVVKFPEPTTITMISAGDSHSAALDSDGRVWLWGTFRGSSGVLGLRAAGEISHSPVLLGLPTSTHILKIASGQDHLVCLTDDGRLLTMGCGEQGQLGRIAERFAKDGGRNGLDLLLQPAECRLRGSLRFIDVWAGGFGTIALSLSPSGGTVYACGLNNYGQLASVSAADASKAELNNSSAAAAAIGLVSGDEGNRKALSESQLLQKQGPLVKFMLTPAYGFDPAQEWLQFALGMHHTLALTSSGAVYAVGRKDYGRLGFAASSNIDSSAISQPHLVTVGGDFSRKCVWIGCGEACSFAVDDQGVAFSWGMGSSQQLGQDNDDDVFEPTPMGGKNLAHRIAVMVDAGGQHTVLLARDPVRKQSPSVASESRKTIETGNCNGSLKTMDASEIQENNVTDSSNVDSESTAPPLAKHPRLNASHGLELSGATEVDSVFSLPTATSTGTAVDISFAETTTVFASSAGATVNSSSLRSCSIATPTTTVSNCCCSVDAESSSCSSSGESTISSLPTSAQSIDGGGSSRLSSVGGASIQSSSGGGSASGITVFAHPSAISLEEAGSAAAEEARRRAGLPRLGVARSSGGGGGGGMSICSTSTSEPGFAMDNTATTPSLGSMTASPMDLMAGGAGGETTTSSC